MQRGTKASEAEDGSRPRDQERGREGRGTQLGRAVRGEPRKATHCISGRQYLQQLQRRTQSGSVLCELSNAICPLLGLGNGPAMQIKWCESRLLNQPSMRGAVAEHGMRCQDEWSLVIGTLKNGNRCGEESRVKERNLEHPA